MYPLIDQKKEKGMLKLDNIMFAKHNYQHTICHRNKLLDNTTNKCKK